MAPPLLHLLVLFLGFSHFICLNAIPITRTGKLMQEPEILQVGDTAHMEVAEEKIFDENMDVERRMAVQLNDYPGSGANHRHTPWPPQLGRCADC